MPINRTSPVQCLWQLSPSVKILYTCFCLHLEGNPVICQIIILVAPKGIPKVFQKGTEMLSKIECPSHAWIFYLKLGKLLELDTQRKAMKIDILPVPFVKTPLQLQPFFCNDIHILLRFRKPRWNERLFLFNTSQFKQV